MIVHVGGNTTHGRYLLLRQRVEGISLVVWREAGLQRLGPNEVRKDLNQRPKLAARENGQNHGVSCVQLLDDNAKGDRKVGNELIDLNAKPQRAQVQASINQEQAMDVSSGNNHDSTNVVPVGSFRREPEK